MRAYGMMFETLAILMLCFVGISECDMCDTLKTDGCTTYLNIPYRNTFEADCTKHDICYSCGQYYGETRSSCDTTFRENMDETCRTDSSVTDESRCLWYSSLYYKAVRLLGWMYYKSTSRSWCSDSWVRQCF